MFLVCLGCILNVPGMSWLPLEHSIDKCGYLEWCAKYGNVFKIRQLIEMKTFQLATPLAKHLFWVRHFEYVSRLRVRD